MFEFFRSQVNDPYRDARLNKSSTDIAARNFSRESLSIKPFSKRQHLLGKVRSGWPSSTSLSSSRSTPGDKSSIFSSNSAASSSTTLSSNRFSSTVLLSSAHSVLPNHQAQGIRPKHSPLSGSAISLSRAGDSHPITPRGQCHPNSSSLSVPSRYGGDHGTGHPKKLGPSIYSNHSATTSSATLMAGQHHVPSHYHGLRSGRQEEATPNEYDPQEFAFACNWGHLGGSQDNPHYSSVRPVRTKFREAC